MPKISRNEAKFYFGVLSLFWSRLRIAKELSVTHITVTRWVDGETLPSAVYRGPLRKLLDDLLDDLDNRGKLGKELAAFLEERIPEEADAATIAPASRRPLKAIITQLLHGKDKVKSTKVLSEAARYGYSVTQVYKASQQLGVIKDKKGFGRASYSYWSLP